MVRTEDRLEFESLVLRKLKVGAAEAVSGQLLEDLRLSTEVLPNMVANHLLAKLESYVWAHRLPPEAVEETKIVSFEMPSTWWDHWKLAHANTRLLKHFVAWRGIRYAEETKRVNLRVILERYHAYPDAPAFATQRLGPVVLTHMLEKEVTAE